MLNYPDWKIDKNKKLCYLERGPKETHVSFFIAVNVDCLSDGHIKPEYGGKIMRYLPKSKIADDICKGDHFHGQGKKYLGGRVPLDSDNNIWEYGEMRKIEELIELLKK